MACITIFFLMILVMKFLFEYKLNELLFGFCIRFLPHLISKTSSKMKNSYTPNCVLCLSCICFAMLIGDDCIAVNDKTTGINITRIVCGPGHGIRFVEIHIL